jgi:hypothetical protein
MSKILERLPVHLNRYFFKTVCMQMLHCPRLKGLMLKEFPSSNFFHQGIRHQGTVFEFEYLRELEIRFENNLGYKSGLHFRLIHEKTGGQKTFANSFDLTYYK